MDLAHIVQSLNKVYWYISCGDIKMCSTPLPLQLDSGVSENILLHSRDEQSVLIVSYSDLKSCIDQTFSQLTAVPSLDSNH